MNDNNSYLFERFAEERKNKLKLSQAEAAKKCGVSREMVGKYERGAAVPGGEVLAAFAEAGADIYYILVGKRQDEDQPEMLNPVEIALLDDYRALSDEGRERVRHETGALLKYEIQLGIARHHQKKPENDAD